MGEALQIAKDHRFPQRGRQRPQAAVHELRALLALQALERPLLRRGDRGHRHGIVGHVDPVVPAPEFGP